MSNVDDNEIYRLLTTPNKEKKKYYFTITVKYSFKEYCFNNYVTKQTDFFYLVGSENSNEAKRMKLTGI